VAAVDSFAFRVLTVGTEGAVAVSCSDRLELITTVKLRAGL
jgi:hypothetical protein